MMDLLIKRELKKANFTLNILSLTVSGEWYSSTKLSSASYVQGLNDLTSLLTFVCFYTYYHPGPMSRCTI